jgi:hypothetical protein
MQNAELSREAKPRSDARSKAPVFVLGCPRSGTTLLYHMLLSSGNFAVYRAESQVFNLLEPRFGNLSRASNRRKLLAMWQDTDLFSRTGLDRREVADEVMANCHNGGDFLRIFMEGMARHQGVQRWADCTPEHLLYLDRIKQTIPDALVIHIIRDGRDVALSLEKQSWIQPFPWHRQQTLEVAALYWDWIVRKGRKDGRTSGADYVEVHYEDLVQHPREVLDRLSGFVGQELDYDKIERVGIGSVSHPNSSFATEMKGGEFSPVCRWKTSLSSVQLARLESLVGDTLLELGYPLHDAAKESISHGWSKRLRSLYQNYFDAKLTFKKKVPFARMLVSHDLPRF